MLKDIAEYLSRKGIGEFSTGNDGDIFIGIRPEKPDECICLFQYAGRQSICRSLDRVKRPALQVQVRGKSVLRSLKKIESVVDLLDQSDPTINGVYYPSIRAVQSPFLLCKDENEQYVYAVNFYVDKRIGADLEV